MKRLLALLLFAAPCFGQVNPTIINSSFNTATAATPTFSPTSPYTGGTTTVTASSTTIGQTGCTMYFDANASPTTAQSTYSFTTSITLYAQVRGCVAYNNSAIATWTGTLVVLPAVLQSAQSATDGVFTATLPNHASGGLSCVLYLASTGGGDPSAIANTAGYTWTAQGSIYKDAVNTNYESQVWCAPKSTDAVSDTVTVTSSAFHGGIVFLDVSNASAIDNSQGANSSSGSPSTGNFTVTGPNDLVLAVIYSTGVTGVGSGFTILTTTAGFWSTTGNLAEYKNITGTPAVATASGSFITYLIFASALK